MIYRKDQVFRQKGKGKPGWNPEENDDYEGEAEMQETENNWRVFPWVRGQDGVCQGRLGVWQGAGYQMLS